MTTSRRPRRTRCRICGALYDNSLGLGCPELCGDVAATVAVQEVRQERYHGYLLIAAGVVYCPDKRHPPIELVAAHRHDPSGDLFCYSVLFASHDLALEMMRSHVDKIREQ